MEACSQSVACRSSEVCRSIAKEPRVSITLFINKNICHSRGSGNLEWFFFLLVKKSHSGVRQNPVATNYIKVIVTIRIPDDKSYGVAFMEELRGSFYMEIIQKFLKQWKNQQNIAPECRTCWGQVRWTSKVIPSRDSRFRGNDIYFY